MAVLIPVGLGVAGALLVALFLIAGRRVPTWLAVVPLLLPLGASLAQTFALAPRLGPGLLAAPALVPFEWLAYVGPVCERLARAGLATGGIALLLLLGAAIVGLGREPRHVATGVSAGLVGLGVTATFLLSAWLAPRSHGALPLAAAAFLGSVLLVPAAMAGDPERGGPEAAVTAGIAFALGIAALAATSVAYEQAWEIQTKALADADPSILPALQAAAQAGRAPQVLLGTLAATLAIFAPLLAAGAAAALPNRRRTAALAPLVLVLLGPVLVHRTDPDRAGRGVLETVERALWTGATDLPQADLRHGRARIAPTAVWTRSGLRLDGAPTEDLPADLAAAREAERTAASRLGRVAPGRLQVAIPADQPWRALDPIRHAAAQSGWQVALVSDLHRLVPLPAPPRTAAAVRLEVHPHTLAIPRPDPSTEGAWAASSSVPLDPATPTETLAKAIAAALPPETPHLALVVAPDVPVQTAVEVLDALTVTAEGQPRPPLSLAAP